MFAQKITMHKILLCFALTLNLYLVINCSDAENEGRPKLEFGYDDLQVAVDLEGLMELEYLHENIPVLKKGTFQNLPKFQKLKLENDQISKVEPQVFINMVALDIVSLQSNNIKEISEKVFDHTNVRNLYLGNNSISAIAPKAFDNMPSLRIIQVNNNSITTWNPRWFKNSQHVQFVLFPFNKITELPEKAFWNIRKSDYIFLDFANNEIEHVHQNAFLGLGTLEILHLEHNKITVLNDKLFVKSRKLEYLSLNNNRLSCPSDNFMGTLVRRIDLNIEQNAPMDCKCLTRLAKWAKEQSHKSPTTNAITKMANAKCGLL